MPIETNPLLQPPPTFDVEVNRLEPHEDRPAPCQDIEVDSDEPDLIELQVSGGLSVSCFIPLTMVQAQTLVNDLQRALDRKCVGKSPELFDSERAALSALVDQANACNEIIEISKRLREHTERLFRHT